MKPRSLNKIKIFITQQGDIVYVYSDELDQALERAGFTGVPRRASYVEPGPDGWTADLSKVAGPVLGPFPTRGEAVGAEIVWLETNLHCLPEEFWQ